MTKNTKNKNNYIIKLNNDIISLVKNTNNKNIKLLIFTLNNIRLTQKTVKLDYNDVLKICGLSKNTRMYRIRGTINQFIKEFSTKNKVLSIKHDKNAKTLTVKVNSNYEYLYKEISSNFMLFNFNDLQNIGINSFYTKIFLKLISLGGFHSFFLKKENLLDIVGMQKTTRNRRILNKFTDENIQELRKVFVGLRVIRCKNKSRTNKNVIFRFMWEKTERNLNPKPQVEKHIEVEITNPNVGAFVNGLNTLNSTIKKIKEALLNFEILHNLCIDNKKELLAFFGE